MHADTIFSTCPPWNNRLKDLTEVSTETEYNPAIWSSIFADILQRPIDSLECVPVLHWCLVPEYQLIFTKDFGEMALSRNIAG